MVRFSRKFTALLVAVSMFAASSTLAPRRSEAFIGLLIAGLGGAPIATALFVVAAVGTGTGSVYFFSKGMRSSGLKAFGSYLVSAAMALTAVYILDEPGAESGDFKSLAAEDAARMGITEAERQAYEADRPLLNSLREEVVVRTNRDFDGMTVKTGVDLEKVAVRVRAHWNDLAAGTLSAETQSAIKKIGTAVVTR